MKIKIPIICALFLIISQSYGESYVDSAFAFGLHYNKSKLILKKVNNKQYAIVLGFQSYDEQMAVVLHAREDEFEGFLSDSFRLHNGAAEAADSLCEIDKKNWIEFKGFPSMQFSGYVKYDKSLFAFGANIIGRHVIYEIFATGKAGNRNGVKNLYLSFINSLNIFNYYIPYKKRKRIDEYMVVEAIGNSVLVNGNFAGRIVDIVNFAKTTEEKSNLSKKILPVFANSLSQDTHKKTLFLVDDHLPYFQMYTIMNQLPDKNSFMIDNIGSTRRNVYYQNNYRYGGGRDSSTVFPLELICNDTEVTLSTQDSKKPVWSSRYLHSIGEIAKPLRERLLSISSAYKTAQNIDDIIIAADNTTPCSNVIELMYVVKSAGLTNPSFAILRQLCDINPPEPNPIHKNFRPEKSIVKIVSGYLPDLRFQYHLWLKNHPDQKGKITFKFGINGSGHVETLEVIENTFQDKTFEECIMSVMKKWKFGKIDNENDLTEIVYPFNFSD